MANFKIVSAKKWPKVRSLIFSSTDLDAVCRCLGNGCCTASTSSCSGTTQCSRCEQWFEGGRHRSGSVWWSQRCRILWLWIWLWTGISKLLFGLSLLLVWMWVVSICFEKAWISKCFSPFQRTTHGTMVVMVDTTAPMATTKQERLDVVDL
jgi:hypothetical protein